MSATTTTAPAYDRGRLVELFGSNPATLAEVEHEFLDTARVAEKEIVNTTDVGVIARAAHRLKGAAGMIGALALHTVAEAVERAAKAGNLPGVRQLQETLGREVARVALQVGA
jgi:HPt (histidine-containing phosphotransfer) domain-containing protein